MIIGIDSMILVYADIVPATAGPKCPDFAELCERSKLLFYKAVDGGDTIVLPTVAMSEVLVPVPKGQKGALIMALQQRFVCPPLDVRAASIAADLWAEFKKQPQDKTYTTRNVVRADSLIVASAYAGNATRFYSHDGQCRALAKLVGMEAFDLPIAQTIADKFLLTDIRNGTVPAAHARKSRARKKQANA